MEEQSQEKEGAKPFSVLERFRQLKKEKEQVTPPEGSDIKQPSSSGTVVQFTNPEQGRPVEKQFTQKRNWKGNSKGEWPTKKVAAQVHQGQEEVDVGISEFIRSGTPFDVLLKHRFTDFQVNEIDLSGNVVKLTSTEMPKDEEEENLVEEEDKTLISPENWDAVREIVEKELTTTVDIDVTDMPREKRQKIHKSLKKRFGVHVYSNTVNVGDKKVLNIGYGKKGELNRRFCAWPRGRAEYLHFVLNKQRCEIHEALQVLSQFTHYKPQKFSYCGTKDKRAVTTQQMCLRRGDVERFKNCNRLRGIVIGNYCYKWTNLRLGDLKGNRFRIALRNVKCSDEVIEEAVESLKTNGFINYFGLQRFGMSRVVPTHAVGKAILKGDWKLAVELLLKPRPGEASHVDVKEARDIWWKTRDSAKALAVLTRKDKSLEGKVLQGLKKHGPNAYQNAMDCLPRHMVTMYLHAVQSLVWNRVVSRRVRECGLRVLPGDLIRVPEDRETEETEQSEENSDDEATPAEDCELSLGRIKVRVLTGEEAEKASISDVYLPLPGDDIRYPENIVATYYKEILAEEDINTDDFGKVCKKYGTVYGTYRQMLGTVEELKWNIVRYSNHERDLLATDLSMMKGEPPFVDEKDGPYRALLVEFNLGVCSYATMAVRELTGRETSTHLQVKLTDEARESHESIRKKLEEEEEEVKKENEDNMAIDTIVEEKAEPMEVDSASGEVTDAKVEPSEDEMKADSTDHRNGNVALDSGENGLDRDSESDPDSTNQRNREHEEETREMYMREAAADNVINKFLETVRDR